MKDRLPKHPGRVKLTPVAGAEDLFDMVRADEPEEAGTPINKQTLLIDETAEELGLDPANDPTPNDAFNAIGKNSAAKVGDIKETMRTVLGESWMLCNGDVVPEGTLPELRAVLPYNTAWKRRFQNIAVPNVGESLSYEDYDEIRPIPVSGQWALIEVTSAYNIRGKKAALYDENTEALTEIECPQLETENRYGIFGLTHDGNRYVLGVYEFTAKMVHLFTSSDLVAWADTYDFALDGAEDLSFDGACFMVLYNTTTSGAYVKVYSYDPATGSMASRISGGENYTYRMVQLPFGYWAYHKRSTSVQESINIYAANSKTTAFSFSSSTKASLIAFFSERYWIALPEKEASVSYIHAADLTTNTTARFEVNDLFGTGYTDYLKGAQYDRNTNEWVLYLVHTDNPNTPTQNYAAYISANANPADKTQYRLERIESIPSDLSYEQMHPDRSQMRTVSSAERYIRDPNAKYLPENDGETYKYIYAGGVDK